jgi:hypothetical protein
MKRTNCFLTGVGILCIGLMLTSSAYSYSVTPEHDYRIDLLASNFVGSVVGLTPSALVALHQPTFVDSLRLTLEQGSIAPGLTLPMHLDFWIAAGSWGLSDTLRVRVDFDTSFQAQPPNWPLVIPLSVVASCSVSCHGIAENEPYLVGPDHVNGGCNSSPPVFRTISCNDTICGTCFTFYYASYNRRDTDWYQLITTEPTSFTWEVEANFLVQTYVMDGSYGCNSLAPIGGAIADSCGLAKIVTGCVPPGTYWFYVSPQVFTGIPQPKPYRAILTCTSCESINPCEDAQIIQCPQTIQGNNGTGNDYWAVYPQCGGYFETGPEKIYRIPIPNDETILTAALSGMSADLDILLLNECHYGACIDGGDIGFTDTLSAGIYYIVVDGYQGAVSNFMLTVSCIVPIPPTPAIVIQRLNETDVRLTWEYVEPVSVFNVYRADSSNFVPSLENWLGSTVTTSYVDEGAMSYPGINYFYRVVAVSGIPASGSESIGNMFKKPIHCNTSTIE